MQIEKLILNTARDLFYRYGIQHITLDDIADKCGTSKNAIYKFYENKSDLVNQTIELQVEELKRQLKKIRANSNNALEELHRFFGYINSISFTISPLFGKELKKYYPNKYLEIFGYKNDIIVPFVLHNIEKGIEEGLYKDDLISKDICNSFDNISKIIFTSELSFSSQINKNAVYFLNSLFMHRLVSVKGLELLNRLNT